MKHKLLLYACILVSVCSHSQVLRPFSVRYDTSSVRGSIVYVSNSITMRNSGANPFEFPPSGSSANNGGTGTNIDIDNETVILPWNTTWKYCDSGYAPGTTTWRNGSYPDGGWPSATAGIPHLSTSRDIGYGDGDEVAPYIYAGCSARPGTQYPGCATKYWTTYFRKQVVIPSVAAYTGFRINLHRDDGAVIYVNGTEVARSNMPTGTIVYNTAASADVDGAAEFVVLNIGTTGFVNGTNTIAVEVHQRAQSSNDLSFRMELLGIDASNTTANSSSADLTLGSCSKVLWAGLYWGASQGTNGTNTTWITGETSVKLKLPGAPGYTTVTSSQTDYHNATLSAGLPHTGYRCFADITSLINITNPNGTYTVADIVTPAGIVNIAGGWTIVIAYYNPSSILRNLTVFDGSVVMNGGDPAVHIPISGFLTPPSGPVSCELGAVVYDGDRVSQDEFSFKQDSNRLVGAYTSMTPNATSNLNDMWNSTISYKGASVTSRNPAYPNTLGYDADIIDVPNAANAVLGNNQTTASIRFSSPSENYFLHTVSTAISVYNPSYSLDKGSTDLNGGGLLAGETLRYRINYTNVGNDASTNTIITDNLPIATSFVPGSLRINGVAKTDASGDDEANYDYINRRVLFRLGAGANSVNGGTIISGGSGYVEFDVYAASSCEILSCGTPTNNIARIDYNGQTSGQTLYDSSGYISSGCLTQGPISNVISGSCFVPRDTILSNTCPVTTVVLPYALLAGYSFYNAQPFTSATAVNPTTPITQSGTYWAYFNSGGGCYDTVRILVYINPCPDIDDDNDGLPDYVEIDNPVALQDADGDGLPNWNDSSYPGYVDNNSDGFNDNFDPSADSDGDGTRNFYDIDFPGYTDTNGDAINDKMDKDLDGIPNHLDLDSDNDGIPDTVESFGVDANGDGRIDNYSDTDNDGLSQNVDGSNTGVVGSGVALGALDTDGDGIGNYLDLDSDNDGITDAVEVFGSDADNNGKIDGYTDSDGDGYADSLDADVGNDSFSENSASSLLRTSSDANSDGRADSFPYKNMENDSKPNPYDLDSDGDGITDVKEAQLTDANNDGRVDGAINGDGRNAILAGSGSLSLANTDATGRVNVYDIDSDDDGIPDNVEGLATLAYALPTGIDTDADGIDNSYDNFNGFGGNGINPYDHDGDTIPDYLDSDTDSDGLIDRIEGNDLNFNGRPDDNVTLTGSDMDGDGLDDRFDNNNSTPEGTSAYMGNGGTTSGDVTPGSITTVQHTAIAGSLGCPTERDWRCIWYVLSCDIINFKAGLLQHEVQLDWKAICRQEVDYFVVERSIDKTVFVTAQTVAGRPVINETEAYTVNDDITTINSNIIYYRLKTVMQSGRVSYSQVIAIRRTQQHTGVQVFPNPVRDQLQVSVSSPKSTVADVQIIDANGRILFKTKESIIQGTNTLSYPQVKNFPSGVYYLQFKSGDILAVKKFSLL